MATPEGVAIAQIHAAESGGIPKAHTEDMALLDLAIIREGEPLIGIAQAHAECFREEIFQASAQPKQKLIIVEAVVYFSYHRYEVKSPKARPPECAGEGEITWCVDAGVLDEVVGGEGEAGNPKPVREDA